MSEKHPIIIGSRGSDLALWQARYVQDQLKQAGFESQINIIVTKGDRIQHLSFDKIEGKGFFTKEIEEALLAGDIDLAVHSLKDLPTESPDGLQIAALSYREDPRDLLLIRKASYDPTQPLGIRAGAITGTSSARRKVQLRLLQAGLDIRDLRGNVPTRIQKCREGQYDAIVLAAAGVRRLELDVSDFETRLLDPSAFVPAPAQGVLGLQIRSTDAYMAMVMQHLHRPDVAAAVEIERRILQLFEGGCHMPVGAYCEPIVNGFRVEVSKAQNDHQLPIRLSWQGNDIQDLAEKMVAACNKERSGHIFISRERDEASLLCEQLEAHGYQTHAKALISTRMLRHVQPLPDSDWLFFVSRNAVRHFLAQYTPTAAMRLAAVGEATARALHEAGYVAHFTGSSNDMAVVAQEFAEQVGSCKVLFPMGNRSKKNIMQALPADISTVELQVYETILEPQLVDVALIACVLSSPSSAEAFLAIHAVDPNCLYVAMGHSTAAYLREQGVQKLVVSSGFRQDQLATAIFSAL
jgi:hydroxymethylbilane synthase